MNSECEGFFLLSDDQLLKIFNSISAHIAILDKTGLILETNAAWNNFALTNGMPENYNFKKRNYLKICEKISGHDFNKASIVASGLRDVINRKTDEFLYDYSCHSPLGKKWFYMRAVLMAEDKLSRVIVSHEDITELKLAQKSLHHHKEILEKKNKSLEEANIALKVLLNQRENDKTEMEKNFLINTKTFVQPYIQKLKQEPLNKKNKTLLSIIENHLNDIISPLINTFSNAGIILTPQELQVAALVKDGKSTSEIADLLYVSEATVSYHRKNLRAKLGIKKKQVNLRSRLMSMT
jgi:DNA-binding CsgD family transcriptional regulator